MSPLQPNQERGRVRKLLAALRSGEYIQGEAAMHVCNGEATWCCLGVACEVFRQETGRGTWEHDDKHRSMKEGAKVFTLGEYASPGYPPGAVLEWFGFPPTDPNNVSGDVAQDIDLPRAKMPNDQQSARASRMNDSSQSFETIADAIEEEYMT